MRPMVLTDEIKRSMLGKLWESFMEACDNFHNGKSSSTITLKTNFTRVAGTDEKVTIIYTPSAYLRMQALVKHFSTEVAWYGLVERIDEKCFRIYDVKLCKQYVDGAKVDTTDEDTIEFFDSLTDEEAEHLHFQAHSHVNMGTDASAVDVQNQYDIIDNMNGDGFYIFQIWNKKGEISTYIYDHEYNVYYDSKDVVFDYEDGDGFISDYLDSVKDMVTEKKHYYPYQQGAYKGEDYSYQGYSQNWNGGYRGDY